MLSKLLLFYCLMLMSGRIFAEAEGNKREANEERVKRSDDFSASQIELEKLAQQVTHQESEITALKNQLSQLQAQLQTARTEVGFQAFRSSSRFSVTGYGTMILDHVYFNNGNGFDTHSGTFTAPVSGTYAFFLTIRGYTDNDVSIDITQNGSARARAYVHHSNTQGTASVYMHLTKGTKVWPKNGLSTNHDMYGSIYTHFSGFLVQADP